MPASLHAGEMRDPPVMSPTESANSKTVISGISCRFPDSDNMKEFRDHLMNAEDMVTEDGRRWKPGLFGLPFRSGKIKDLKKFDAEFFGVTHKQANTMNPELRMLLEVTYEAIVDAGFHPERMRGSNTGVFVGASESESRIGWSANPEAVTGYAMTGAATAMLANRISYFFDFKGPSYVVDTACSSSLVALDHAVHALQTGVCDQAIVAGASIAIRPNTALQFNKLKMLSPVGKCKSFDASADGYCRSEGVVAILIQRETMAKRVYATVLGSESNCDGYKEQGITFPSGEMQRQLLKSVYSEAGIDPSTVAYVEAHGTGTKVGDPQEVNTIVDVFCKGRQGPLKIGSVKSNMGHPEPSSGLAALAKVLITLEEGIIPPNLHYNIPNPNIPALLDGRIQVITEPTPITGKTVGINSFGFGGANVHAILKSTAKDESIPHPAAKATRLFVYSARTEDALQNLLYAVEAHPESMDLHALYNESTTTPTASHPYRGYCLINSEKEVREINICGRGKRPVWFVFPGMGTQWPGMGQDLMDIGVFQQSILRSDKALKPYGINLHDMLMEGEEKTFESATKSFVCVTAIQIGLVDILKTIGVEPDGIVGHSVGELGCGYADGGLSAEETILAAYWRGSCVQEANLPPGGMAAVGLTWEEAEKRCPEGIIPVCHNAVDSVTVSGPQQLVLDFVSELKSKGIFAKSVNSAGMAFHSKAMLEVAPSLKAALDSVIKTARPRSARWVSSSVPREKLNTALSRYSSAEYYVNNLVSPVMFHDALQLVPRNAVTIEIAPHCLLQAILKRSLGPGCVFTGLMKKDHENNLEFLLSNIGKCYMNGVNLNPLKLHKPVEFPVARGTPMISPTIQWDHSHSWNVPTADMFLPGRGQHKGGCTYEIKMSPDSEDEYLRGHKIDGQIFFPEMGYMVLTWRKLAMANGLMYEQMPVSFEDVHFHHATIIPENGVVNFEVNINHGSGKFEVMEGGRVAASGKVSTLTGQAHRIPFLLVGEHTEPMQQSSEDVYKEMSLRGYDYGPTFQGVVSMNASGSHGVLLWEDNWIIFLDFMMQSIVLSHDDRGLRLPTRIKNLKIDPTKHMAFKKAMDGKEVLEVHVDNDLDVCQSGGVEMLGLHRTVTPREHDHERLLLEEQHFIPNLEENTSINDAPLVEYMRRCEDAMLALVGKSSQRLDESGKPSQENLVGAASSDDHSAMNLDRYSGRPDCILANFIREKAKEEVLSTSSLARPLGSYQAVFKNDWSLGNMLKERFLKPCLDIVLENTAGNHLKVVELSVHEHICDKIVPLLNNRPMFTSDYTIVCLEDESFPLDELKEYGAQCHTWSSDIQENGLGNADLVIAANFPSGESGIPEPLLRAASIVKQCGFLLIYEYTSSLLNPKTMCSLAGNTGEETEYSQSEPVTCSTLHSKGFEVICQKSDGLLGNLFLCRLQVKTPIKVSSVNVDDLRFDWVDSLKDNLKRVQTAPPDHRLWITSEVTPSGVVGLVNCLKQEPGGDRIRCAFISNLKEQSHKPDLSPSSDTWKQLVQKDLVMNIYRDGEWGTLRHLSIDSDGCLINTSTAYADVLTIGDLSSLRWIESPLRFFNPEENPGRELCDVYFTSLNDRDVMLATGTLPPDAVPGHMAMQDCLLGMEFSGRDSSGQRVMGLVPAKGLATVIEVDRQFMWPVPAGWSLEDAVTVPVVYSTVYYALVVRVRARKGDRVLIHSGTGGVGQAAITVATHIGCEVFTTVGTAEKREYLKRKFPSLRDDHISNSRDTTFEYDFLKVTKGKGVDVVLNTLAGEMLQSSLRVLAPHGRFLELGTSDLSKDTPLGMSLFLKNISFHGILVDALFEEDNKDWQTVSNLLMEGINSGVVRPLPTTVFDKDDLEGAFRFMEQGQHIGKVMIKVRVEESQAITNPTPVCVRAMPRTACHPDKIYIITGGIEAFGLELSQWLIDRGAKKLILTSRSGLRNGYQSKRLKVWRKMGRLVMVSNHDTLTFEGTERLVSEANKLGPIGGIFHLDMVLQDDPLESQSKETFKKIAEAKVTRTINLDHVTRAVCKEEFDWFVVFSSIVSGRANAGKANGFANSYMERVCEQRRADGYPGTAIQWDVVGDEGTGGNDICGSVPQKVISCLSSLDYILRTSHPVVSSFVMAEKHKT